MAFGGVLALGQGIEPSGVTGQQLAYLTRRSYLMRAYTQIYTACPTLVGLLSKRVRATGGIDNIMVNVQYQQMVQPQNTDFTASFNAPQPIVGIQPAAFAYSMVAVPIPVYLNELLIQSEMKIQDLIDIRMADAGNATRDFLGQQLWSNISNYSQLFGIPWAIDDGTNNANWGNIPRAGNPWWQSKRYNVNAAITRSGCFLYLTGFTKYSGETPHFGVAAPATWAQLGQDYLPNERYIPNEDKTSQYLSAFRAYEVAGVPVFMDPYATEGFINFFNTNYMAIYIHEKVDWEFLDFQSMVPAYQLNFTGVALLLLQLVVTKPRAQGVLYNITGTATL
jgi:hypothetical protein